MNNPNHAPENPKLDLQKPSLRPLGENELRAVIGAGDGAPVLERNKRVME